MFSTQANKTTTSLQPLEFFWALSFILWPFSCNINQNFGEPDVLVQTKCIRISLKYEQCTERAKQSMVRFLVMIWDQLELIFKHNIPVKFHSHNYICTGAFGFERYLTGFFGMGAYLFWSHPRSVVLRISPAIPADSVCLSSWKY